MKSTGITRQVDELGRLVIPKELRKNLNLNEKDTAEIFIDGDKIVIQKYIPGCQCCKEVEDLVKVMGVQMCPKCIDKFYKAKQRIIESL